MTENYRHHCNTYRPHSSLGYHTPNKFTLNWSKTTPGSDQLVH